MSSGFYFPMRDSICSITYSWFHPCLIRLSLHKPCDNADTGVRGRWENVRWTKSFYQPWNAAVLFVPGACRAGIHWAMRHEVWFPWPAAVLCESSPGFQILASTGRPYGRFFFAYPSWAFCWVLANETMNSLWFHTDEKSSGYVTGICTKECPLFLKTETASKISYPYKSQI